MSSAQIERDFSVASLVLESYRGSMDATYFQAQLCTLMNFLHLVHPEDMSPKSMSDEEVSEVLPTCIPKGCMMTPTTRDMTVRETDAQCVVLPNKVCLVC